MRARASGFTLIEVIVLIVVISVSLAGVLLLFQNTVRASADPQVYKQALAIGEAMLDEILLASYDPVAGGGGARANFNDVDDYAGYSTAGGMTDIQGNVIAGLAAYNVSVAVNPATLDDSAPATPAVTEAKRITVTVTHASGVSIPLEGYRAKYTGP